MPVEITTSLIRMPWRALAGEAVAGCLQRPARTVLTTFGVVLGVGSLVAVLGLATTAAGQVSERFTALAATEVTVEEVPDPEGLRLRSIFPADAEQRVTALNGAVAAGVFWTVPSGRITSVSSVPLPGVRDDGYLPVVAATPGLFDAVNATIAPGRTFDEGHHHRAELVAVLGTAVAARLGITTLERGPVVFLNQTAVTVIGVVHDVERRAELLSSVIVPQRTAEALWGAATDPATPPQMIIETELGAAQLIADQAALALRPDQPDVFKVTAPPDPRTLREQVTSDLSMLYLLLAGVSLVIGSAGIANTMVVAVLERSSEIGLRRAMGARRWHVAGQFLIESAILGTLGGLVGAAAGVGSVVAVAIARDWTPIMEPAVVLAGPVLGLVVGLVAGAYPAIRAARTEPADALR